MSYPKEDFLKIGSQPENAYLLGLMWADGYVDKKYQIELCLKSDDFDSIKPLIETYGYEKFKYSQKIYKGNIFGKLRGLFKISNVNLNQYLRTIGYREKSTISPKQVLETIPDSYKYLWWRGYFDGDGCFYYKLPSFKFTIWGSIDQDWKCVLNLYSQLNIDSYTPYKYNRTSGKSSCIIVSSKKHINTIGNYIYQSLNHIGLKRKQQKFIEMKKFFNS